MKRFLCVLEALLFCAVLFGGDSLMVNGVFPMELLADYGISSCNLSSCGNTLAVTYWTMMNALDYADPELIVVGIKDVDKKNKLTGSSSDVHSGEVFFDRGISL